MRVSCLFDPNLPAVWLESTDLAESEGTPKRPRSAERPERRKSAWVQISHVIACIEDNS